MGELRHILRADQFSRDDLDAFITRAAWYRERFFAAGGRDELRKLCANRILLSLFFQPSTRTRMFSAAAAMHLGMQVIETENAKEFSSAAKGEITRHTIQVLSGCYPDVIVMRHDKADQAAIAARYSTVPIINAGDGKNEHPTQGLIDLDAIHRLKGRIDGLTVMLGGDLWQGRTVHSLARMLCRFHGMRLLLVSPPELALPDDVKDYLRGHDVEFSELQSPEDGLRQADVVYWTRLQKEHLSPEEFERLKAVYIIGKSQLASMKKDAILLHPMPIDGEIAEEAESDPRTKFIDQAHGALFMRMACYDWVLNG